MDSGSVTGIRLCWIAVILTAATQCVAADNPIYTDWTGVRARLSPIEGQGRNLRIVLLDGRDFSARLIRVEENSLVVRARPATRQWAIGPDEAAIPRSEVVALHFRNIHGYGRLIGTLAGLGLMAVAVADPGERPDRTDGTRYSRGHAAAFGAVLVPTGFLVGWFADRHAVELRPQP